MCIYVTYYKQKLLLVFSDQQRVKSNLRQFLYVLIYIHTNIIPLQGDEKAEAINSLCHIQYYENGCMTSEKISDKLKPY
jgi:uncharacterized protein YebE (UPF0316 family)